MLFTELPLCDSLLEGLQAMNFKETTPVQEQAIPVILEKKDVIACAQTGTGKTAAFLLPLLNNLQTDQHEEGKINAIVMAPTRELAQQIDQQMEGFSYFTPFSSVAVYGGNDGEAWDIQKRGLLSGADVVIATPGRLLSHINLYNIDFSGVKYFILDEADRMLDMGFHEDIMKIEKLLPKNRQTVMFSATMPPKIQQLAKNILHNPLEISIAISRPPDTILQSAYICHEAQKINIVKHLFKEKAPNKVILFSGSKQKVKEIAKILSHMGLSAGEMHSDLDQTQRNHVMHEFKNDRVNILVATDIVSRGIDIDDISLVINFDVPYDAEDYVHRIGRTARAGDSGMAITFVSPEEQYRFYKIEQFLGKQIYRIPVPAELGDAPEYNPSRDNRRSGAGTHSRPSKGVGKKEKEGGRRNDKSTGKTERPERAEYVKETKGQEQSNGATKTTRPKREGRPEKAISETQQKNNNPEGENVSRTNKSVRKKPRPQKAGSASSEAGVPEERVPQSGNSERNTQKEGQRRRNQGNRNRQNIDKRADAPQGLNEDITNSSGSNEPKKSRGPRKPRSEDNRNAENTQSKNFRNRDTERSNPTKKSATSRHASRQKDSEMRPEQKKEETGGIQKWLKWWPFGKK